MPRARHPSSTMRGASSKKRARTSLSQKAFTRGGVAANTCAFSASRPSDRSSSAGGVGGGVAGSTADFCDADDTNANSAILRGLVHLRPLARRSVRPSRRRRRRGHLAHAAVAVHADRILSRVRRAATRGAQSPAHAGGGRGGGFGPRLRALLG